MAKPAAPENETNRQKFVRLANSRTNKALDAIGLLTGLANPANYEYTEEDWKVIFSTIEGSLTKLQEKVKNPSVKNESGFALKA